MTTLSLLQDHPNSISLPQIDNIDPFSLSYNRSRDKEEEDISSGGFNWRGDFDWEVVKYKDKGRKVEY